VAFDDEGAVWSRDPEWAPGHPEFVVGGVCDRFDFDATVDGLEDGVELERDAPSGGVEVTLHLEAVVLERRGF
jgi:hypothetical protein